MTKSTITRERLAKIKSWRETYGAGSNVMLPAEEAEELARIALAAMGSEPHTDDELSNLLWYSQEATCHSDPNYYCEFQRLATPGLIAGIIRELQERRKADSEPVAEVVSIYGDPEAFGEREIRPLVGIQQMPYGTKLYRHAQQPVVPDDLAKAFISAIEKEQDRLFGEDYLMDSKDCIDVIREEAQRWNACCATMLQAAPACTCPSGDGSLRWPCTVHPGNSPVIPDTWIPVSEQKPDCWCRTCRPVVLNDMRFVVCPDCGNKRCPRANDHRNACTGSNEPGQEGSAYPDTPREVK
ncbi:hypothetical protein A9P92_17820 [Klebsiella pneumoniae]|uniref:hypothetical protein n=1 Tax=Klebsiella pneumoniae TaxID=573 RepID=UPI00081BFBF8|nr:hypothetical protein [Klebsiella pneumoniae]OCV51823.1 hypothetical protein A9P92_17820 [Klebsiella pneumoniae]